MQNAVSDLTRAAELALRNEERLQAWRARYHQATGRHPVSPDSLTGHVVRAALVSGFRENRTHNATTNATTCKTPRRKRQYMHTTLPTPPEVA